MNPESGRPITVAPSPVKGAKERPSVGHGGFYTSSKYRESSQIRFHIVVSGSKNFFLLDENLLFFLYEPNLAIALPENRKTKIVLTYHLKTSRKKIVTFKTGQRSSHYFEIVSQYFEILIHNFKKCSNYLEIVSNYYY